MLIVLGSVLWLHSDLSIVVGCMCRDPGLPACGLTHFSFHFYGWLPGLPSMNSLTLSLPSSEQETPGSIHPSAHSFWDYKKNGLRGGDSVAQHINKSVLVLTSCALHELLQCTSSLHSACLTARCTHSPFISSVSINVCVWFLCSPRSSPFVP